MVATAAADPSLLAPAQGPLHFAGRLATLLRLRPRDAGALSEAGKHGVGALQALLCTPAEPRAACCCDLRLCACLALRPGAPLSSRLDVDHRYVYFYTW